MLTQEEAYCGPSLCYSLHSCYLVKLLNYDYINTEQNLATDRSNYALCNVLGFYWLLEKTQRSETCPGLIKTFIFIQLTIHSNEHFLVLLTGRYQLILLLMSSIMAGFPRQKQAVHK